MLRKDAIKIIAENKLKELSKEDREELLYDAWEMEESEEEFFKLSVSLQQEMLTYSTPQYGVENPIYDELILIELEEGFEYCRNNHLSNLISRIIGSEISVEGKEPILLPCPCCGYKTLIERGDYDICPVCFWEDDSVRNDDNRYSGPNHMTLQEAKDNYLLYGAVTEGSKKYTILNPESIYEKSI